MKPQSQESLIRLPGAAGPGNFYPSHPDRLRAEIEGYLAEAERFEEPAPWGIISPHAGYRYSGPVAAWGYKQLVGRSVDTVIVLAPSHFEHIPFVSLFPSGVYRTPLGDVPIDEDFSSALMEFDSNVIRASKQGHIGSHGDREEHSLEVQLPFLQVVLGDFKLVAAVISRGDVEVCRRFGEALAKTVKGRRCLLVASSDLSHYHPYKEAYRLDQEVISKIQSLDAEGLIQGCLQRRLEACGGAPIASLLYAAKLSGAERVRILRHATSGDVPEGLKDQVVGYLAAAVYPGVKEAASESEIRDTTADYNISELELSPEARRRLLQIARQAVAEAVAGQKKSRLKIKPEELPKELNQAYPLFVTLRRKGQLRGCIGQIAASTPLYQLTAEVAQQSALSDPRFNPVAKSELAGLEIEITILSPMQKAASPDEVVPGKHGVLIRKGYNQGLLLPQVAEEQGWDREQFLSHTCRKAGLFPDAWRLPETEIYVFTAEHFSDGEINDVN